MKKNYLKLLIIPLFASVLTGCDPDMDFEIELESIFNKAYVDEEYDLTECFTKEKGYYYSAKVYSYDVHENTETEVPVKKLKFTPTNTNDLSVVLSASRLGNIYKKTFSLTVGEHGDPIEDLLISSGASGFADGGFSKTLNKDSRYKRPGNNNKTSIYVSYKGNSSFPFGGGVIAPNNFRCLDYWTDKEWTNAIFRFWCYNNSDYDIEFGFRLTDAKAGIDIDMGHEVLEPGHIAAPHAWSEIKLSLRALGIVHPLYVSEDATHTDSFTVKTRYKGIDRNQSQSSDYTYDFYLDEIDVVPASYYPNIETSCYKDGWEYMTRDTNWEKGNITSDFDNVCTETNPSSTSSKKITFENIEGNNPHMALDTETQFSSNLPDFTKGIFKFDVKYNNISDRSIKLKIVSHVGDTTEWIDTAIDVTPTAINNGWYHLNLDLSTAGIPYTKVIRICFIFNGVNESNKMISSVNIDNIFLVQD